MGLTCNVKELTPVGRFRVPEDEKKVNTKIRIRADLKKEARERGLNLSQVMEEALKKILNKKF